MMSKIMFMELLFTEEETPFSITYLGREIFIKAEDEKALEDMQGKIAFEYGWLRLRAVMLPEDINPFDLEMTRHEEGWIRYLDAQNEENTFNTLFLLLNALQPARVVLAGGGKIVTINNGFREAVLTLEHPESDLHGMAVRDFLEKYEREFHNLLY